ncbi:NADP-dependent oxidoreductase [Paraburkholderia sediminicola]|uniref:NADP-dependent oxidoreductase n=1 Tax=Paraburkholderia sediminicola TaxID=458836 RepID=UPI000BD9EAF3|nr:NADPH:quinone reductase [Burkholderia sp. OK233]
MQAIQYSRYGGPDVLERVTHPDPVVGPGDVRVRMRAAGVAPLDTKLRAGLLQQHFTLALPMIPGRDGIGVVDQVGEGVRELMVGDVVCVLADLTRGGTCAEMIVCSAERAVLRPANLSDHQAAVLLQPGISAWSAVVRAAHVTRDAHVLIHGGAGAVGSLMVQLARHLGAHVSATCRADNVDYVLGLGAHRAIAYDRDDFSALRDHDMVFDLIGGTVHARSYPVLRRGGHLVYLTADSIVDRGVEFGVTVTRATVDDQREALLAVAQLAEQGIFRPAIAGVFPIADAAAAHRALETKQVTRGRLVLEVDFDS